ncbi:hypothetical protein ATZ36_00435 [Candidatus Endomicrobiellum trichonymphae]|uniref:Uncharacterized protein n=1 Tax=Endomicrobium trichonymphae TaxID=1408204 RepID=A0A1E5IK72_ENDTX|nr:hypothetical protein ATZ36_11410 [Candidatus Endomicrobium trichonymphae]OEG70897.1 hypothetical protein ATZ36_00435 [Candidatus Endomicrobium trichonymphae]
MIIFVYFVFGGGFYVDVLSNASLDELDRWESPIRRQVPQLEFPECKCSEYECAEHKFPVTEFEQSVKNNRITVLKTCVVIVGIVLVI